MSKQFSIAVLDVKEAPVSLQITSTAGQQSFTKNKPSISENSVTNSILGTVIAQDPDANAKLTFQLDDTAGGRFKFDSSSRVLCTAVTGVKVIFAYMFFDLLYHIQDH